MAFKIFSVIRARFFNTVSDTALDIGLNGETNPKLSIDAGGKISWGAGDVSTVDTNLYRDSANVLKTDDTFKAPSIVIDTDTLVVDAVNDRVGIGTDSPSYQVHVSNTGAHALLGLVRTDGVGTFIEAQTTRGAFGTIGADPLVLAYNSLAVVEIGAGGAITVNPDGASPFTLPTADGTENQVLQTDGSGSVSWADVSAAVTDLDSLTDVVITSPTNGQLLVHNGTNWVNDTLPTMEPMGHEDRTDSTISFNNGTRVFTIQPAVSSYTIWCAGNRYVKSSASTVTIPDTTGLYYIYFDSSGVLQYKTTYFTWDADTPTAYIYWNSTTGAAEFFADERHGITLDWQTHEYLHRTRGAAIASGFGISSYSTDGDGSSDAHTQIALAGGTFFDEDLQVDITHAASPTANTWEQVLEGTAEIPVFYRSGTAWVKDTATTSPFKAGTSRAQYNVESGGSWSTADVANNKYGAMWIVATNNLNEPVIAILGQTAADNQSTIEERQWEDLDLDGLPIFEIRPLYRIAFVASDTFSNTLKAAIRGVLDIRRAISSGSGIPSEAVSDHGTMTGLADDDHTQYLTTGRHDSHDHSSAMSSVVLDDISNVSVSSPTTGDFLKWDGSSWTSAAGGSAVSVSDTPPGSPSSGELWWESDTGKLKIYYNDGDSSQWVDAYTSRANVHLINSNIDGGSASSNYGGILALNGGSA